tara:strand:- start:1029 stop:1310 length:282 start_codon:yes stop_codon:yes gene_type:complete
MIEDVSVKTKMAFVLFVLGKMTSLPAAYFIFKGMKENAILTLSLYSILIISSIILAYLSSREKNINRIILKKYLTQEGSVTLKITNGKVTMIE